MGLFGKNEKRITFCVDYRPWEYMVEMKGGGYSLVRADEETRKKQLDEYKKEQIAILEKRIEEIKRMI